MKIEKTPSGNYRARLFLGRDADGRQRFKSITAPSKAAVQIAVAAFLREEEQKDPASSFFSLGRAIDAYIDGRRAVLSPTTVTGYKYIRKMYDKTLLDTPLSDLRAEDLQKAVSRIASGHPPKTTKNAWSLVASVLKKYRPGFRPDILLPQKIKQEVRVPTRQEYAEIVENLEGPAKTAVILAASAGMRMGEILALEWANVDLSKKTLRIDSSMAFDEDRNRIIKPPKTTESTRTVRMTPAVFDVLSAVKKKDRAGYVCPISNSTLYHQYIRAQKAAGIEKPFRFHDLRHYFVSVCLSLNIPKNYIASMVGHSTERMIDAVYGHVMADKQTEIDRMMETAFQ